MWSAGASSGGVPATAGASSIAGSSIAGAGGELNEKPSDHAAEAGCACSAPGSDESQPHRVLWLATAAVALGLRRGSRSARKLLHPFGEARRGRARP
jgi:MYXO-CTERM domain-containing protein